MNGKNINLLAGMFAFLDNFYSHVIVVEGLAYATTEHYFQAHKTLVPHEREAVRTASTPGKAKALGQKVTLRKDWEKVKVDVMRTGLEHKFQNGQLWIKLQATGSRSIVEGNSWHDNIWGDCHCERCRDIPGQNLLGKLLVELREKR